MRRHRFTILLALAAIGSSIDPIHAMVVDELAPFVQPDGTQFPAHVYGDEFEINWVTADGYAFVHNEADDYLYYAELDDEGDFQPSEAKVGIDDPLGHGIQKNLQRSAACRAKIQAERIAHGYARQTRTMALVE